MELKNSLKKFRMDNNLTQDDLGKKIGLSGKVISKWESGYSMPDIDNVKKLCEIFDCEYADLIGPEKKGKRKKKEESKEESKDEIVINNFDQKELNNNSSSKILKIIAGFLYVFAKIYHVFLYIAITLIILLMICIPSIVSSVKVGNNSISFTDFKGDIISITGEDILLKGDYILKYKDKVIDNSINFDIVKEVADIFNKVSKEEITVQVEIVLVLILISLIIMVIAFHHLEIFLKNIRDCDNLFIKDNVNRLAMAACLFIGAYVCDLGISFLVESFASIDIYNVGFNKLMAIFFMILMVCVFNYGNEMQKKNINVIEA